MMFVILLRIFCKRLKAKIFNFVVFNRNNMLKIADKFNGFLFLKFNFRIYFAYKTLSLVLC